MIFIEAGTLKNGHCLSEHRKELFLSQMLGQGFKLERVKSLPSGHPHASDLGRTDVYSIPQEQAFGFYWAVNAWCESLISPSMRRQYPRQFANYAPPNPEVYPEYYGGGNRLRRAA